MRKRSVASSITVFLVVLLGLAGCGEDATAPPPCYQITYSAIESQSVALDPARTCYESGTSVVATATSGNGWVFVGWSGAVTSSQNPLSFQVGDGNVGLVANYAQELHTLDIDVAPAAGGQVEGPPLGSSYETGEQVTLTAYPSPGYAFVSWSGGVTSTSNPLTVTMTDDLSLTAGFEAACYDLTVGTEGAGSVQVTPDESCYAYQSSVSILAIPGAGSVFVGWSGDASGTVNPLVIDIEDDTSIVAEFGTPLTITFVNPVFTDIEITVVGAGTKTIPPGSSVDYAFSENPGSVDVTGQTGGETVQETPIGLLLGWNFTLDVAGETSLSVDLIVPSDFFYVYVRNQGTENLGPLVVNPNTQYETVDDILLPNDGLLYRTGYYYAFSGMQVRAFFPDQMRYVYWTEGVHFQMPWVSNQSVQLTNTLKRSGVAAASEKDMPTYTRSLARLVSETSFHRSTASASTLSIPARAMPLGPGR